MKSNKTSVFEIYCYCTWNGGFRADLRSVASPKRPRSPEVGFLFSNCLFLRYSHFLTCE